MGEERPKIPAAVKREVRQRCGFGCVFCGSPVYQYDHMIEYSIRGEHEPDNLTLLCPFHHGEKSLNRLPFKKVVSANQSPYNLGKSSTTGHNLMIFAGSVYTFGLGSNLFIDDLSGDVNKGLALNVDGGDVLSARIQDGELLIRANLRDRSNRMMLRVMDNELVHSTSGWDVQFVSNRLTMWDGSRKIGLEISLMETGMLISRGEFWANGFKFSIGVDGALYGPRGSRFEHCEIDHGGIYAGDPRYRPKVVALDFGDENPRTF